MGCTQQNSNEDNNSSTNIDSTNNTNPNLSTTENTASILTINNRCIGCGKCARIAPQTFQMEGRKAIIVSQQYLNDQKTQMAIRACHPNAIDKS
ncbi:MAG: ferredoxin [Candidatus Absconditabacteria bacterium]